MKANNIDLSTKNFKKLRYNYDTSGTFYLVYYLLPIGMVRMQSAVISNREIDLPYVIYRHCVSCDGVNEQCCANIKKIGNDSQDKHATNERFKQEIEKG